jgi:anthranilate synthase component 1
MFPTIDELKTYAKNYRYAPVKVEVDLADFDVYQVTDYLDQYYDTCLQLTINNHDQSKFTYIVVDPSAEIRIEADGVYVDGDKQSVNAHEYLNDILTKYRTPKIEGMPPFSAGITGYFAYEYIKEAVLKLKKLPTLPDHQPLARLLLADIVIAYDHERGVCEFIKLVDLTDLTESVEQAEKQLTMLKNMVLQIPNHELQTFNLLHDFTPRFAESQFAAGVEEIRKEIEAGEVFQLIYSNPQHARLTGNLIRIARQLDQDNPSPYELYFHQGTYQAVVASPETLVRRDDDKLMTYPLAGTRRRGKTEAEDIAFEKELTTSKKELSEHNMLVDLGRNDLGAVSKIGSVKVTTHAEVLKFSQVMHLGSVVESTALDNLTALDLLDSVFPAGTLSGAPKVHAIELIYKHERITRGIYGGCFGYFDFNGDVDMGIGIRLVYTQLDQATIHSGAGIVADSNPKHEYQEGFNKARAVNIAIIKAEEAK